MKNEPELVRLSPGKVLADQRSPLPGPQLEVDPVIGLVRLVDHLIVVQVGQMVFIYLLI